MKTVWTILATLLVSAGLFGAYRYGVNTARVAPTPTASASPEAPLPSDSGVACTMEAKICPDGSAVGRMPPSCEFAPCPVVKNQTVTGGGILSFPKYTLEVPASWTMSRESHTKDDEKITLTAPGGSPSLSILQGGFGGAVCLYAGDADQEGPSVRYTSFVEIKTKSGATLRRGTPENGSGYGICELTQYGWSNPTLFGAITVKVGSPADLPTLDLILASLDKTN